jgi:basic membrane lipoprotein Med (substrate-binding protein (PBP1-ABC) superfamily)
MNRLGHSFKIGAGARVMDAARKALVGAALLLTASAACSLIVNTEIKKGAGATCGGDSECQGTGAVCDKTSSACVVPCSGGKCPNETTCSPDNLCKKPIKVGVIYDGKVDVAGFAKAHRDGILALPKGQGYEILSLDDVPEQVVEQLPNETTQAVIQKVFASIDKVVAAGADTVIMTTGRFDVKSKIQSLPKVRFFVFNQPFQVGVPDRPNHASIFGNIHQSWYQAGFGVGKNLGTSKCVAALAPLAIPEETISQLNAFSMGLAKASNGKAKFYISWFNDFFPDTKKVDAEIDKLTGPRSVDGEPRTGYGCDVIVNRLGFNYPLEKAVQVPGVKVVGLNNKNVCDLLFNSSPEKKSQCIGSVYWNFAPPYQQLIAAATIGKFESKAYLFNFDVDENKSMFGFNPNLPAYALSNADQGLNKDLTDGSLDLTFSKVDKLTEMKWWGKPIPDLNDKILDREFPDGKEGVPQTAKANARKTDLTNAYSACWFHASVSLQRMAEGVEPFSAGRGPSTDCDANFQ